MLSKPHDASARIADKRTALGVAVVGLLGALAFAGQAGADVPVAGALSSVATPATQSVALTGQSGANVTAPSSKDLPQAAGDVVAPVSETATQSTDSVVAPATKVVTQGVSSTTQAAGATTHAASDTVAPVLSGPSSSPPLSAAPPSLGVEGPGLPLGGGRSSKGAGEPGLGLATPGGLPPGAPECALAEVAELLIQSCAPATILPGAGSILPFSVASTALASLGGLLAVLASGAGHNGSPPASIPSSPGPSPGGVSESTVAACGFALSIFLTLAGLSMLAAPHAMRRLRLASEPWRLAPFVLIPERPG
jgi:hypothetical protein